VKLENEMKSYLDFKVETGNRWIFIYRTCSAITLMQY